MDTRTSVFLDFARFSAALAVFLHHLLQERYLGSNVHIPGPTAVLVFFVISGFVIAFVVDDHERDWRTYFVSRFARIYSVAIPALALTAGLYVLGRYIAPSDYPAYDHVAARLMASVVFLNQFWNLTILALNNGPYWSLAYEVWYYALFGIFMFMPAPWKIPILAASMLIIGPRILLLMPVWLMGVFAYYISKRWRPSYWQQAAVFAMAVSLLLHSFLIGNPLAPGTPLIEQTVDDGYVMVAGLKLFIGANPRFFADYYLGALVAAAILSCPAALKWIDRRHSLKSCIRVCASYTFSLYLYHVPLLICLDAVAPFGEPSIGRVILLFIAVSAFVVLLGRWTEHKKAIWARFVRDGLVKLEALCRGRSNLDPKRQ